MMAKPAREAALELETRDRIYSVIRKSPGLHFRELRRRLDIAYGTLQYHLEVLAKNSLIDEEKRGDYSRYYPVSFRSTLDREFISLLRQKSIRRIIVYLVENPGLRNKDLVDGLGLTPPTISWHISRLVKAGAVIREESGNEVCYRISEPEVVARLLITYRPSFIDKVVDRFVELWEKEKC